MVIAFLVHFFVNFRDVGVSKSVKVGGGDINHNYEPVPLMSHHPKTPSYYDRTI